MLMSPPPRIQFAGAALVWSRSVPSSNVEFTQKLPGTAARAMDKSSMAITPVVPGKPPEAREQRILTALAGTSNTPFRFVNVEFAIVLTQPALRLLVPEVKSCVPTTLLLALKN